MLHGVRYITKVVRHASMANIKRFICLDWELSDVASTVIVRVMNLTFDSMITHDGGYIQGHLNRERAECA